MKKLFEKIGIEWQSLIVPLFIGTLFTAMVMCQSCRGPQSVTVENTHSGTHDTVYIHNVQRDSLYLRDSIYIDRYHTIGKVDTILGVRVDTVVKNTFQDHYFYKNYLKTDTVLENHTDTLVVQKEREVVKVKEVRVWKEYAAMLAIIVVLIGWILMFELKKSR